MDQTPRRGSDIWNMLTELRAVFLTEDFPNAAQR
jgi:hypothetical protein